MGGSLFLGPELICVGGHAQPFSTKSRCQRLDHLCLVAKLAERKDVLDDGRDVWSIAGLESVALVVRRRGIRAGRNELHCLGVTEKVELRMGRSLGLKRFDPE